MADTFINIEIETDESTLADGAVQRLRDKWTGWEPNDGDLEVVQIEVIAPMAADAAVVASVMPAAAFRQILSLFKINALAGVQATGEVTFDLIDASSHTIPQGTEVDIDGYAFTTSVEIVAAALSVPGVPVKAVEFGTEANDLEGDSVVLATSLSFVEEVTLDAPTSGGVDPETEEQLENRGSKMLELQALTLVTVRDYEIWALSEGTVQRAIAIKDGVTRTIKVYASIPGGLPLDSAVKAHLLDVYEELRETTWVVSIEDDTLTSVSVDYSVHLYPTATIVDSLSRVDEAISSYLDPDSWGQPRQTTDIVTTTWYKEDTVRKNKLIDLIGSVEGVDYVDDLTITAAAGASQPNGDWLLPGVVPLPTPGDIEGTVV